MYIYIMSNSTILYSDCFEYSQKALASKQMDEKALVELLMNIDGKSMDEVKAILSESISKLGAETAGAATKIEAYATEALKAEEAVLEVRDVAVAAAEKAVEEVSAKCSMCVPLGKPTCS